MAENEKKGTIRAALLDGKRMMVLDDFTPFPPMTSLVAYVDLLGFKAMILKDPTGKDLVPLLEESISAGLVFANIVKGTTEQLSYRVFSDNICFWCSLDAGPLSLSAMLATLSEFQLRLSWRGIFCRGGLAIGHHYASENVLYGPALVEAVELEKIADYPRILVSDPIMEHPDLTKMAAFYYQIHKLPDDHWFINYLWGIYFKEKEHGIQDLRWHSEAVIRALEEHAGNSAVHRKYEWCRAYHNDAVSHLTFATDDMKIGDAIKARQPEHRTGSQSADAP
jgi:hypothetical protein